ncbi:unnamed protein product, partial [Ilex paraguariensis]
KRIGVGGEEQLEMPPFDDSGTMIIPKPQVVLERRVMRGEEEILVHWTSPQIPCGRE